MAEQETGGSGQGAGAAPGGNAGFAGQQGNPNQAFSGFGGQGGFGQAGFGSFGPGSFGEAPQQGPQAAPGQGQQPDPASVGNGFGIPPYGYAPPPGFPPQGFPAQGFGPYGPGYGMGPQAMGPGMGPAAQHPGFHPGAAPWMQMPDGQATAQADANGAGQGFINDLLKANGLSSLSSFFNFNDTDFLKGLAVGAAAVLLLTNSDLKSSLLGALGGNGAKDGQAGDKQDGGEKAE